MVALKLFGMTVLVVSVVMAILITGVKILQKAAEKPND